MKSIIRFFVERHLLANIITFLIILLGIMSLFNIKRDMFPTVDLDRLTITTRYPGASAEDVELNVTNKIEEQLKGVDGLETMTSYSMENISVINITIDPDASDKDEVKRDVRDGVGRVGNFPSEVTDAPYIFELKSDNFEIIWVGISGEIPYAQLRDYARHFEKKLKNIEGVSRAERMGYLDREIKVEVSQKAIDNYQIPMREIVTAIQLRNIRASGGSFESYTSDKNIVALAQFEDPIEVGDVIVRSSFEGPRIHVKDLAVIKDDFEPEKTRFRMNGKSVIAFKVFKKGAADIIRVIDDIKEFVDDEQDNIPEGIELMYSSDMSRFVKTRLGVLSENGLIGLGLVVLVLFVFLNFRTSFWVAMGIPLTMMGVIFVSPFFGVYIDLISMMGMIIVIGLIVDDAIVVAENISYHREVLGEDPINAAINGTNKVIRPVFATILTSIMAFSPFFFMSGMMGKFIFSFPLVIVLALVISFGEVIMILPSHVTPKKKPEIDQAEKKEKRYWFDPVKNWFQRFIVYVLAFRYIVAAVFIAMLVAALWYAANFMQFEMFPGDTADQFYITVELPTGSSMDATTDKIKEIEDAINALPKEELDSYWTLVGSLGGGEWFTPGESENWTFMYVTLSPFSERSRTAEEIVAELRAKTEAMKGIDEIRYIIDGGGPPVGRPIAIRVQGSNDILRKVMADSVMNYLSTIEGVTDLGRDDKVGKEQVSIKLNYNRLSEMGLTVSDVAQNVRLAYDGMVVTRVRYGEEDVNFRVLLEERARKKQGYLGRLKIPNRQGRLIPLKNVASFKTEPGPSSFFHFDGERTVTVTGDIVEGSKLNPVEVSNNVLDHFENSKNWPGMQLIVSGEAEEQVKSMISLAIAMAIAVVGIYFVLVLLFNSLSQPILVMLAIPFGLIGVVGAFALHEETLGFMAMMGVIGMMGVVVNDSLILVNFINMHRREDRDKKFLRIVAEGTSSRLRPILMTSITTVCGLVPTAYGFGGSDPFIASMALALGYGILFATPLTLLLLPCLYMIQDDIGKVIRKIPGLTHFDFFANKHKKNI